MKLNFIGIGGAFYTELGCNAAYIKEEEKILFIVDYSNSMNENIVKAINEMQILRKCIESIAGDKQMVEQIMDKLEIDIKNHSIFPLFQSKQDTQGKPCRNIPSK